MNQERITELIEHMSKLPDDAYNQKMFAHFEFKDDNKTPNPYCGSPACIAGHAVYLFDNCLLYTSPSPRD